MILANHLNQNLFTDQPELVPNRNGYGEGLKELGESEPRVVALAADLTESTRTHLFAEAYPERFVQCGITEQSMASVASGMAAMGKIPFIASYAMFSPGRNWEQIRTTIAYNNSNVKIIGAHAGVSVGPDGATHQALEDMAIMRVVPNMIVLAPVDVHEAKRAVKFAAQHQGPVYIRVAREKTPVVTTTDSPFNLGKGEVYVSPDEGVEKKVMIVSTGTILAQAMLAAKTLNEEGVGVGVANLSTVKPLDYKLLSQLASEYQQIVTLEEHQVYGGLGSAVCEYLSENQPTKITRLGINDQFGQSGAPAELYDHFGISAPKVVEKIKTLIS